MSDPSEPTVVFGWKADDDESVLRELRESLARDGGVNLLALNQAYLRGLLVPASELAAARAEVASLTKLALTSPAINPVRMIAVAGEWEPKLLALYVDGTKFYEPDEWDGGGALACLTALGVKCHELLVCFDGPLPDSLDVLMEADDRVRRWECDAKTGLCRDPKDGSLWTEEGQPIEENDDGGHPSE